MSEHLKNMVNLAVAEVVAGKSRAVLEAMILLGQVKPEVLFPELFLQVEEAAEGVDLDTLTPTDLVPEVEFAQVVVNAVTKQDIALLRSTVEGDHYDLLVALVSVIALLKSNAAQ